MTGADRWKSFAVNALDASGLTSLLRPFYGGCGAILAFHRVIPDDVETLVPGNAVTVSQLGELLSFLKRHFSVVSLQEVPRRLETAGRFIAITFDDGYRDNYELGLPIFREFQVPFAVFPCTAFISRAAIPWLYLLEALCLSSDRVQLADKEFVRAAGESRLNFFRRVAACGLPEADLTEALKAACGLAGMPWEQIADQTFLSWAEARALAADPLLTIGVHTVNHAWLAGLTEEQARWEMTAAREELARKLGVKIDHIAYPFGSAGSCGPREFRIAEDLGFKTGLTTKRGNLHPAHAKNIWALPRHTFGMAPHSRGTAYLRISLNGIWDTPLNGTLLTR